MDILKKEIRKPIVRGLFYPETPLELSEKVHELLHGFPPGDAQLILCPHGTWEKTGLSIGAAFAAASLFKPDKILLLGPVHREKDRRVFYLSEKKYFETPLGLVDVDRKTCRTLAEKSDLFIYNDSPHMEEHALELQLPFIQILFPQIEIIPLLAGSLKRSELKKAAGLLKKTVFTDKQKILIILSANMSRYGLASETEVETRTFMENLSLPLKSSLLELEREGKISSCGSILMTLMSDLGIFEDSSPVILGESKTEVSDRGEIKAVYYAGISWS
ncbi:AmmeMemoRadiSam system protein B [Oceanispirochaeta sp.]|jgi:AmmeMemoRadiSam system protein B|uniref:AmmeMemoRadiSam system protein B n=1 Tax=Oceanispirochaeta sp. TaxID=2035350 RepID=UPI00261972D0|nr:AmmeMemoRadiSam system protein B [Oceanispirochaeta sp.]MDA3956058.1 AmmeMemoRadiSam system protein B [Oceanispirochaeta sp.]